MESSAGFWPEGDSARRWADGGDCSLTDERLFFSGGSGTVPSSGRFRFDAEEGECRRFLLISEVMLDEVILNVCPMLIEEFRTRSGACETIDQWRKQFGVQEGYLFVC